MSTVLFDQGYAPAEAERGKFAVIDPSTMTGLSSASRGRYAMLTYSVGTDASTTVLSGGLPNKTSEFAQTFAVNTSATITFSPPATLMEISNRSSGSIYLTYNPTTFITLTASGLSIAKDALYSIERTTTSITIGSVAGGDVVIFGHYKHNN